MNTQDFLLKTYQKAIQNFEQANFISALKQFKYCLNNDYEVRESYTYLGIYYFYQLKFQDAFMYLQMAIAAQEHNSMAYYYLALLSERIGNTSSAIEYYKKSIDYATDSIFPLRSFIKLRDYLFETHLGIYKEKAFQIFVIELHISQKDKILIQALKAWAEEHIEALDFLQQLQKEYPKSLDTSIIIAEYYFGTQDYDNANKIWRYIEKNFHLSFIGLYDLARIAYYQENYRKSSIYLKMYLNISEQKGYKEYFNLANLYHLSRSYQRAILFYEKSIALNNNFFPALFNLGVCLQTIGNFKKAIIAYEKSSSLEGNNAMIFYNLGLIYFEQKDYLRSLFNLNKAYQIDPEFKDAQDNFYYISFLHKLTDKEFSKENTSLFILTLLGIGLILIILTIMHTIGII